MSGDMKDPAFQGVPPETRMKEARSRLHSALLSSSRWRHSLALVRLFKIATFALVALAWYHLWFLRTRYEPGPVKLPPLPADHEIDLTAPPPPIRAPWTIQRIQKWYKAQPWLVGANYVPHTASNQFEMFQADTFNLTLIDFELGIAEDMGMNTLRVFLHDLLYKDDPKGFFKRLDQFLDICKKHSIRPMFVIFDSCWDPNPHSGKQEEPVPRRHNSRWAQSPGQTALADVDQLPRLKQYVQALFKRFGKDDRILAWDMYNEPDNGIPPERQPFLHHLMMEAFEWAREIEGVIQPLTSGIWKITDFTSPDKMERAARIQIERSDFVTFHTYFNVTNFEWCVNQLKIYKRPIVNTEWLARGQDSTVEAILPVAKRLNVGAINWGFVDGRTQTKFPWDSWWREYPDEPEPWHHELIRRNGTPYSVDEFELFKRLTDRKKKKKPRKQLLIFDPEDHH